MEKEIHVKTSVLTRIVIVATAALNSALAGQAFAGQKAVLQPASQTTLSGCRLAQVESLAAMGLPEEQAVVIEVESFSESIKGLSDFTWSKPSAVLEDGVLKVQVKQRRGFSGLNCKFKRNAAIAEALGWDVQATGEVAEPGCAELNTIHLASSLKPEELESLTIETRQINSGPAWLIAPILYKEGGMDIPFLLSAIDAENERFAGMHYCKLAQPNKAVDVM